MIVPESALPKVAPGEAIATVCDGLRLDAIVETAELAGSYARSAAEAAWRGIGSRSACTCASFGWQRSRRSGRTTSSAPKARTRARHEH